MHRPPPHAHRRPSPEKNHAERKQHETFSRTRWSQRSGISIRFYSALFGADPVVTKSDYAKWMVEDPRINFAISQRGEQIGVNHLGLQVDSNDEPEALRTQAGAAELAAVAEKGGTCCYARSDKYWYTDRRGVAWETYHTLNQVQFFGSNAGAVVAEASCGNESQSSSAHGRQDAADRWWTVIPDVAHRRDCGVLTSLITCCSFALATPRVRSWRRCC